MTTPAAPPSVALAAFYRDGRAQHTIVKILDTADPDRALSVHVEPAIPRRGEVPALLAGMGWAAMADVQVEPDGVWLVPVQRTAEAQATEAAAVQALARVRADIAHRQGADGAEFLAQFLAHNGDTDGATAVELARLVFEVREASDLDGAYEDAYGDGFDRD